MPLGNKERILVNIEEDLELITLANNYNGDVGEVDRQFKEPPVGDYEHRSIYINDIREVRTQLLQDLFKVIFHVGMVLYVNDVDIATLAASEILSTTINLFIGDVKTALLDDPTRNDEARNTLITSIMVDTETVNPPQAAIILMSEIEYYSVN